MVNQEAAAGREIPREQLREEEDRVADIKKCLHHALHVQVMKVNIDRSKLMVKALRDRVDVNKDYFKTVLHYK